MKEYQVVNGKLVEKVIKMNDIFELINELDKKLDKILEKMG